MSKTTSKENRLSPYAIFHISMRGWDIFDKFTGQKQMKSWIYYTYRKKPEQLKAISERKHEKFRFEKNENHRQSKKQ